MSLVSLSMQLTQHIKSRDVKEPEPSKNEPIQNPGFANNQTEPEQNNYLTIKEPKLNTIPKFWVLSHLFVVQRTHLRLAEKSFSVAGPHAWNSLPSHTRTLVPRDSFSRHLKTHCFQALLRHSVICSYSRCCVNCICFSFYF